MPLKKIINLVSFLVLFMSSRAFAYDISEPSRPGSQIDWFLDHQLQREYDRYRNHLKWEEKNKTENIYKHLPSDKDNTELKIKKQKPRPYLIQLTKDPAHSQ
ncbi:MAG: hypothetical protein HQM16_18265 [Deltaproteobacteria bacterium]|nr:hypothetical protein [Deltaproteobacteria bacterium]